MTIDYHPVPMSPELRRIPTATSQNIFKPCCLVVVLYIPYSQFPECANIEASSTSSLSSFSFPAFLIILSIDIIDSTIIHLSILIPSSPLRDPFPGNS